MTRELTAKEKENRERLRLSKPLVYDKVVRYNDMIAAGKSVAVIQLQYNYLCNMKCVHCSISGFQNHEGKRTLTPADVKSIADQAHAYGLAQIDLTGGEPLTFKDLDAVVAAIGPERFYLMCDTNGWLMTPDRARHLKSIGVDRVQISLDSLDAQSHDDFRRKKGAHAHAMKAIDAVKGAGLALKISTVITPGRIASGELIDFFEFTKSVGASVNAIPAKPVGEWTGQTDLLLSDADMRYLIGLNDEYDLGIHTAPHFGVDYGCIAVKKILTITAHGDTLPCIWMYLNLGNVLDTPLSEILDKGMRYFGEYSPACHLLDADFNEQYLSGLTKENTPMPIEQAFSGDTHV